eukprot:TRINITY_DN40970_c0_g1_i1.p3 TRINITY_DN40970_c0_g1~~TRINITY_DN40970_c0_g1_i1.p3  ORF type:complete len:104 (-),score=19.80 TRINITY_DN40970_c0_g1_i1:93-383(-)
MCIRDSNTEYMGHCEREMVVELERDVGVHGNGFHIHVLERATSLPVVVVVSAETEPGEHADTEPDVLVGFHLAAVVGVRNRVNFGLGLAFVTVQDD